MPNLSGPAMDAMAKELKVWYVSYRQELIATLEEEYPYGAVRLSPLEQYNRFLEVSPQDYEILISKLNDRYRGLPNQYNLVNRDLANYMAKMVGMMIEAEG